MNKEDEYNLLKSVVLLGVLVLQKITGMSDTALAVVMKFFLGFISLVSITLDLGLDVFLQTIPRSLNTMKAHLSIERDDYHKFSVCHKCKSIYAIVPGRPVIRKCTYKRWPRHNIRRLRQPCDTDLYHDGTNVPNNVYCVKLVSEYLRQFVTNKNFVKLCNEWRHRNVDSTLMSDIYDGKLWKEAHNSFLKDQHNIYGIINIDWFEPFKHSVEPVGAIYMVLLNLPRRLRFREENVMLLGLIPGPDEPSLTVNSFIRPIVDDLKSLNNGILLQDGSPRGNIYKLRLFGCSSDLRATRKLGGFLSYHAKYGKYVNYLYI